MTVRYAEPGGAVHDAVGILESWAGGELVVRRRDGTPIRVPAHAVVAARVVAERRVPVRELERIAALGWQGLDQDRLGDWLLRAAQGWTGRANSALPLGDPGLPLAEAVTRVEEWYAARGLPPAFQVPLPDAAPVEAVLVARGYAADDDVDVMVAPVPAVLAALPRRTDLPPVDVTDVPGPGWLAAYHYRGGTLPEVAPIVLANAARPGFASVTADGRVVAIARAAVDLGWVGVTAVEVEPAARRRGLARHVMRGLLEWGARHGAHHTYLQVTHGNAPAIALYTSMGYAAHHRYHYCRPVRP